MMTKIYDIAWEIDAAGRLVIEQGHDSGNDGDVARVELHPMHVRLFAEELGLYPQPEQSSEQRSKQHATLVRRMALLRDRAQELFEWLDGKPSIPPGIEMPEAMHAKATLLMANEFLADFQEASASGADETRTSGGLAAEGDDQKELL